MRLDQLSQLSTKQYLGFLLGDLQRYLQWSRFFIICIVGLWSSFSLLTAATWVSFFFFFDLVQVVQLSHLLLLADFSILLWWPPPLLCRFSAWVFPVPCDDTRTHTHNSAHLKHKTKHNKGVSQGYSLDHFYIEGVL